MPSFSPRIFAISSLLGTTLLLPFACAHAYTLDTKSTPSSLQVGTFTASTDQAVSGVPMNFYVTASDTAGTPSCDLFIDQLDMGWMSLDPSTGIFVGKYTFYSADIGKAHNVSATCHDAAGTNAISSNSISLSVTDSAPTPTPSKPSPTPTPSAPVTPALYVGDITLSTDTPVAGSQIEFSVNVNNNKLAQRCFISLDGSQSLIELTLNTNGSWLRDWSFPSASATVEHSVQAQCQDTQGNSVSSKNVRNFYVSPNLQPTPTPTPTPQPQATLTVGDVFLSNSTVNAGTTVLAYMDVNDNNLTNSCYLQMDGTAANTQMSLNGSGTWQVSMNFPNSSSDIVHSLQAYCLDSIGREVWSPQIEYVHVYASNNSYYSYNHRYSGQNYTYNSYNGYTNLYQQNQGSYINVSNVSMSASSPVSNIPVIFSIQAYSNYAIAHCDLDLDNSLQSMFLDSSQSAGTYEVAYTFSRFDSYSSHSLSARCTDVNGRVYTSPSTLTFQVLPNGSTNTSNQTTSPSNVSFEPQETFQTLYHFTFNKKPGVIIFNCLGNLIGSGAPDMLQNVGLCNSTTKVYVNWNGRLTWAKIDTRFQQNVDQGSPQTEGYVWQSPIVVKGTHKRSLVFGANQVKDVLGPGGRYFASFFIYNFDNGTFARLAVPSTDYIIWNKGGTRGAFITSTCEGSGCDATNAAPVTVLSLTTGKLNSPSPFRASSSGNDPSWPLQDSNGQNVTTWKSLHWINDTTLEESYIATNGKTKTIRVRA